MAVIEPETELERRIVADPDWQRGASWGRRMKGHPEAKIADHVAEVLDNIDHAGVDDATRARLRLIALVHDTFKQDVRWWHPGRNDHAKLARRFAERYVDDEGVLLVTELHDDGFRAWRHGKRTGRWNAAEARARALRERLGEHLPLFLAFYRADNATGTKSSDDLRWFERL
jgi:hypothetical protein